MGWGVWSTKENHLMVNSIWIPMWHLIPLRPSFVKADHGDELLFVFGDCFTKGHVNINGKVYAEVGSHTCLLVHVLNNNKLYS